MILLIVVMAVVMLLAAQAWKKFGPAAMQVGDAGASGRLDDRGETAAGEAVRSGELPRLQEAQNETDAHASRVQEALKAIE